MTAVIRVLLLVFLIWGSAPTTPSLAVDDSETDVWHSVRDGEQTIRLYFVYSTTCPHCLEAKPFVEDLTADRSWLEVEWLQVNGNQQAVDRALAVADTFGADIRGVPTFMFCEQVLTGFDSAATTGAAIATELDSCRLALESVALEPADPSATPVEEAAEVVDVPLVGDVEASSLPLPVFTVVLAALDAFNPCAFFVLLFLLSLLVHTRSRSRMAAVGGTFVVVSGVLYFLFLVAWLNVFVLVGHLRAVTVVAGMVALTIGVLNVKDYAVGTGGPSVSISERAQSGLFARMRRLTLGERLLPVLGATLLLAVVANSYELLCTAGLPMVFTRVLTMNDLSQPAYYGYVGLYSAVYVVPLLAIVGGFVAFFGSRKLLVEEGRRLKLLSGSMMVGLGALLLVAPDALTNVGAALVVIGVALLVSLLLVLGERWLRHKRHPAGHPM